jgi:hypothetical protein
MTVAQVHAQEGNRLTLRAFLGLILRFHNEPATNRAVRGPCEVGRLRSE